MYLAAAVLIDRFLHHLGCTKSFIGVQTQLISNQKSSIVVHDSPCMPGVAWRRHWPQLITGGTTGQTKRHPVEPVFHPRRNHSAGTVIFHSGNFPVEKEWSLRYALVFCPVSEMPYWYRSIMQPLLRVWIPRKCDEIILKNYSKYHIMILHYVFMIDMFYHDHWITSSAGNLRGAFKSLKVRYLASTESPFMLVWCSLYMQKTSKNMVPGLWGSRDCCHLCKCLWWWGCYTTDWW